MSPSGAKVLDFKNKKAVKRNHCIFCHSSKNLQVFQGKTVCTDCLSGIKNLYLDGHFQKNI